MILKESDAHENESRVDDEEQMLKDEVLPRGARLQHESLVDDTER